MATFKAAVNKTNHFVLVLDASGSMTRWKKQVIAVADNLVNYLADDSKALEQETRITVYAFSGWKEIECLIYDMDVLRMPSIETLYDTYNMTALLDATHLAIDDLLMTPQKYGDHSFVLYVLTDGQENNSRKSSSTSMGSKINSLPENWTVGIFVPDSAGVARAINCGFPEGNTRIWDATSAAGFETVGKVVRDTSRAFMEGRKQGVRGYNAKTGHSLFRMADLSVSDIKHNLDVVPRSEYVILPVPFDCRIDDFVVNSTGRPYKIGSTYYRLTKTETIQPNKQIAILLNDGNLYMGEADKVRTLLQLPSDYAKVAKDVHRDYTIYVQSTAINRKLVGGTDALVFPNWKR